MGEKQGPEFNYLLSLVQPWMISMEAGGPSAVNSNDIPAPKRKRAGLNKFLETGTGLFIEGR